MPAQHSRRHLLTVTMFCVAAASVPGLAQVDCTLQRHEEIHTTQAEPLRQAAIKAERIVLATLAPTFTEPLRVRTSIVIEDRKPYSAHLQIAAWPKPDWAAGCAVVTTIVATAISIDVYFNTPGEETILDKLHHTAQPVGSAAGHPLYNNHVVLQRNGRLPVIPETVKDWMDNEQHNQVELLAAAERSKPGHHLT